jgi:hypothetical protein
MPPPMPDPEPEPPAPEQSPADFAETMRAALAAADATVAGEGEARSAPVPRRRIAAAIGWLLFALTTGVIGAGYFAQGEIMARFPQTRAIYQALHLPVPQPGDGLEVVAPTPSLSTVDGTPTFTVTGKVRNVGDMARAVPAMRVSLRDAEGKEVAGWEFAAAEKRLEPGAETEFSTALPNPPSGASQLQILFLENF